MVIGNFNILERNDENVLLKVDKVTININKVNTLDILCDPYPNDTNVGAFIKHDMSFEDFVKNIDEENNFIDDLFFIKGIAIF